MSYPKEQNQQYLRDRYAAQRSEMYSYLGGKCVGCGSTEYLQFDHVDPAQKAFDVGALWGKKNLETVYKELDKCQLLCGPCHRLKSGKETSERLAGTFTHGSMYTWLKLKCNCNVCEESKQSWRTKRNASRRSGAGYASLGPRTHGEYSWKNKKIAS